ncbi:MAG: choice-of-anchor Q domain-containing protein [Spirosomataceae bacterium]
MKSLVYLLLLCCVAVPSLARTWFVKPTGTGTDGTSWATAVDLKYALRNAETCMGEVLNISSPSPSQTGTTGSWTVPVGGPYKVRITAKGAKGGNSYSGAGAVMVGEFIVFSGQVLQAQAGSPGINGTGGGGGGGGSGVQLSDGTLLILAGGGGGGSYFGGGAGRISSGNGNGGVENSNTTAGGSGGGILSAGGNGGTDGNGSAPTGGGSGYGATGGNQRNCGGSTSGYGGGGFGGGGGGNCAQGGGGGGGYTGGNGGTINQGAGGGGSYNLGSNQNNAGGANNGGGQVIIECLGAATVSATATPTQPTCASPTQGSLSIDLSDDLNGANSGGVEYAIVSGNSFSGTPTFAAITADPLNLSTGTGTTAGAYTVRIRLKYNPTIFVDQSYTLARPCNCTFYVKSNASGTNNGSSWTNAFTNLQDALATACSGAQIWVAKGTYKPGTSRSASFSMKAGVKIYGSFAGTESDLSERTSAVMAANTSVLSGDLNDNDVITGSGSTLSITGNDENCYHVVKNDNYSNPVTTNNSLLDGFTISGGNGSYGGGMYNTNNSPNLVNITFLGNYASLGGAIYNTLSASPSLTTVTFEKNQASKGGGMYNNSTSSPALNNVIFRGNKADGDGGGICNESGNVSLSRVYFINNQASYGGGIYDYYAYGNRNNVVFLGNIASENGGGIYSSSTTYANFNHITFIGNQASNGGGIFNDNKSDAQIRYKNGIFWGNTASGAGPDMKCQTGTIKLNNCLLQLESGNYSSGFSLEGNMLYAQDPLFVNAADPDGADNIFGTADDGIRLSPCSPAINVGDNSGAEGTDITGNPRIFGSTVDLGAYEYQANPISKPTATASTTSTFVCQGKNLSLAASGGNTFSWNGPIGSNFSSTAQNLSLVASSTVFSGVYSVTVLNANCPLTATATVSISVQQATVNISPNPLTVCLGQTINLSANTSPTASAFSWKGPAGFSSAAQSITTYATTTANLGIYSVSATIGSCTVSAMAEVKSNAILKAGVVGLPCVGGTIQLTASGMTSYSWSRPTNNFNSTLQNPVIPSSTMNDAGIYFLTARSGSCVASALMSVLLSGTGINPAFSVSPSSVAAGATVSLSAASATGTYLWSGPNSFSGNTRTKTLNNFQAANNGVYRLTLTVGTCKGYAEKTISLNTATRLATTESEPIDMNINAYPNPVTHTLTVEVRLKEPSALQLNLVNSVGKNSGAWQLNEVSTFHQTELNLADLQGGIYLLQAQADKQKIVKRVVKIQY